MLKQNHLMICLALSGAAIAGLTTAVPGQTDASPRAEARVIAQSRFAVTNPRAQAELVQLVVDFPPGAWTSSHTHGGQGINLVLEGEVTLRQGAVDHAHRAGQAWTDSTGILHAAGNTGTGNARLLTNFLLPPGAPTTTAMQDSKLEPTVRYEARFPLPALPAQAEIVQRVIDLPPGWLTEHAYDGFVATLVVNGEVTLATGREQKTYTAGESWSAEAGTRAVEENKSGTTARVFATYLVPQRASQ
jgi:quercetin dioxygenase-like cupin family protein